MSGFSADIDYMNRNIKSNFKQADRYECKYVIVIGEDGEYFLPITFVKNSEGRYVNTDNDIVYDHIRTYPMMEPIDAVKLAYQSEFGPAHMISDIKHAEKMVERERAETKTKSAPLFCHIGNGYVRLDLSSEDAAICSSSLIARIFAASASDISGTREGLLHKLEIIRGIAKEGAFSLLFSLPKSSSFA